MIAVELYNNVPNSKLFDSRFNLKNIVIISISTHYPLYGHESPHIKTRGKGRCPPCWPSADWWTHTIPIFLMTSLAQWRALFILEGAKYPAGEISKFIICEFSGLVRWEASAVASCYPTDKDEPLSDLAFRDDDVA
ncbi:jg4234 [Pararge aegeria aegeria]|uniref:Jg4234 protein n=1 Tax=Pararge aegeria aegeria TaxID=348720 RepID=A0A8S4QI51_9NEOP|nr:jg4234 [Pararge aegeria aegeria]